VAEAVHDGAPTEPGLAISSGMWGRRTCVCMHLEQRKRTLSLWADLIVCSCERDREPQNVVFLRGFSALELLYGADVADA
jgi:hypothetical protein